MSWRKNMNAVSEKPLGTMYIANEVWEDVRDQLRTKDAEIERLQEEIKGLELVIEEDRYG